ncbi:MAG: MFS transporter, partial [Proteobacteria bacterium]
YPDAFTGFGVDTFVVKAQLEYHASAHYDQVLDIGVRVGRLGRTSMQFVMELYHGDVHLVSGEIVYVMADPSDRTPLPIPAKLREAIARFERVAPQS